VEKEELAAWLVILKEFQCGWRGALRLHLIGALKNRSTVSWFIFLFVCIVSNTMYFYTQKINRVVITPGSQAVCIVYVPSKWLIVKNTRQSGSILYIYICIHCLQQEEWTFLWVYIYLYICL
jgi:hypothetical protein